MAAEAVAAVPIAIASVPDAVESAPVEFAWKYSIAAPPANVVEPVMVTLPSRVMPLGACSEIEPLSW
ncbi:hypothetical protein [Caballeronia insecticola]|uniref:hypothetical protein n=1 Tax=Caballeronia insecticola TaxID=758793 RepID=UPI0005C6074F|nr:hypothetical protein [Caballeronia insecticola]